MISIEPIHQITFLSGRPSSGKTRTAIETCRLLLNQNWNIIYWHAEGPVDAGPTEYGVESASHLLQMQLVLDLHFSTDDLRKRILRPTENPNPTGTLIVIDTLDFFDCTPDDFFIFIETFNSIENLYFLILTQIPRHLENKTRDHAEAYIEAAYKTQIDHRIVVLGDFPDEC